MKKILLAVISVVLTVSCSSIEPPQSVEKTEPLETIDLKLVTEKNQRRNMKMVRLNKDGIGQVPFKNDTGRLYFKYNKRKLYFDSNNDGKFEGVDAEPIERRKVISVPVEYNGVEYKYDLQFPFGGTKMIYLTSLSSMVGDYNGTKIHLYDKNCNGDFSDLGVDLIKIGNASQPSVLGKMNSLASSLYNFEFESKGSRIKLSPYDKKLAVVELKVDNDRTGRMQISHVDGKISATLESGDTVSLIPGDYKVRYAMSYVEDPENKRKRKELLSGRGGSINVSEDDKVLKMGAPFELVFDAFKSKDDSDLINIKSVNISDAMGIKYRAKLYYGEEKSTLLSFIKSGQKEQQLSKMEYG